MSSRLVIDASVALSWAFEDEADVLSDRVLDALVDGVAVVPAVWPVEVSNGLVTAQRRGRITPAETARFLSLIGRLPVQVESFELGSMASLVDAAREYNLSAYDASYLALAMSLGAPLATQDAALQKAATAAGVELFAGGGPPS
ncbi:MAG: type II toxin-antitoxin system VapC family toxin [Limnochordaceae bacterium]|nr:type II toxin-antitoxin system VapC family toxin [Limnochordaceae bacterium]